MVGGSLVVGCWLLVVSCFVVCWLVGGWLVVGCSSGWFVARSWWLVGPFGAAK